MFGRGCLLAIRLLGLTDRSVDAEAFVRGKTPGITRVFNGETD